MKKYLFVLTAVLGTVFSVLAQNTWIQKASISNIIRGYPVGFSIAGKGYIGLGRNGTSNYLHDIWEYDPQSNAWTQKANYPSVGTFCSTSFVVGSMAYVGLGYEAGIQSNFWQYDPANNLWTVKASFPGTPRYGADGFSIGTKGYLVAGSPGGTPYLSDAWCYDPTNNSWAAIAAFPGGSRSHVSVFSYNGKGYAGQGSTGTYSASNDMWEYDPTLNSWTSKASMPGTARRGAMTFSISNLCYVCSGLDGNGNSLQDVWEYDAQANSWVQRANFGGNARWLGAGFSINGYGYAGAGTNDFNGSQTTSYSDFWRYGPSCTPPTFNASHTNVSSCSGGSDGSASVTVTGGSAPFTYSWNTTPAQTTTAISNLTVGVYVVTITDGIGCATTSNITITQPQAVTATITATNATCYGANNGSASATGSGGTPPYSYSWNTIPAQTTQVATGLYPGSYTLTVSDVNGCSGTNIVSVTEPTALNVQSTIVDANCGASDGKITTTVTGGTVPYSYLWNTLQTTQIISNLASGTYSLDITDSKGCTLATTVSIGSINADFNIAFSANPQAGIAPLTVPFTNSTPTLGNYDFTWVWGDGADSINYNNPTAFHTYQYNGYYDVTLIATDKISGCTDTLMKPQFIYTYGGVSCTHTVAITPAGPLTQCQGDTVVLTANTNAVAPFTYQWSINSAVISGATDSTLTVTQSGYYSLTVIKGNCPKTSGVTQVSFSTSPAQPTITSFGSIVPCVGGSDSLVSSTISGATYQWNTGETSQSIIVTNSGNYWVTATNTAGCSSTSAPFIVNASLSQTDICMVTVDSTSTKNLIVWEKPASAVIDSFKIYREVASVYKHIASLPFSALSEFTDTTSGVNPKITSYKYELSVVDICGNESPLSTFHRTIHLAVSPASPCGYNLFWNDYTGFPISQYRILRDSANTGWKAVDSVSFGNTSWSDVNCYPAGDTINYMVEVLNPAGCTVSIKNPQPLTNLNLSKSNFYKVTSTLTSASSQSSATLNVSLTPNPSSGVFTVKSENGKIEKMEVYNVVGEKIYTNSGIIRTSFSFDISSQPEGVYFLNVKTENGTVMKKIIIQK